MPNIGALWAEMRVCWGSSSCFCGENKKVPGYFLQVVGWVGGSRVGGWVPTLKIPFFQKVPSKRG